MAILSQDVVQAFADRYSNGKVNADTPTLALAWVIGFIGNDAAAEIINAMKGKAN